jgi:DNA-binding NarL/FixJ family response regulator
MMREGLPTDEIARRMFISPVTVRSHVSAILRKLNVPDRQSALRVLEEQERDQYP